MDVLIRTMIYLGSALMIVNIIRYFIYAGKIRKIERIKTNYFHLYIPLALLIFFLIGYLVVAVFADPDLMVAGILFGGSVFVFMLLMLVYSVTARIIESDTALENRYIETKNEIESISKEALSFFRVNLSKNVIEDIGGSDLYRGDSSALSYDELMHTRSGYVLYMPENRKQFLRENLLRAYKEGHEKVSEVLLAKRPDGSSSFIILSASMAEQPSSGDVIAFIYERPYDDEMVNNAILDRALTGQYDMIAFISNGCYDVISGNVGSPEPGSVLPPKKRGLYRDYLDSVLMPMLSDTDNPEKTIGEQFSLDGVQRKLNDSPYHEVNAVCSSDGELYYKRFVFYPIYNPAMKFVLMVSDTTEIHKERTMQTRQLADALYEAEIANEAKTRFFSNFSHEIRTPMNAITGLADIAQKTEDKQAVNSYLEKIKTAGTQLLSIIDKVLEVSRIEGGKTELTKKNDDLAIDVQKVRKSFGKLRALVVDDNEINREIIIYILTENGFETEEAVDGKQALDLVRNAPEGHFDLILTDIQMPEMDGFQMSRSVRDLGGTYAGIPIIAITANAFEKDSKKVNDSGIDSVLYKPVDNDNLIAEIHRFLEKNGRKK